MGDVPNVSGSAARLVRAQLADGSRLTAAEIGLATGIPRSTVVHALRRLAKAGEIEGHSAGPQRRGRPSRRWSTQAPPGPVAVVVGGVHGITVGVATLDGAVLSIIEDGPLQSTVDGLAAGPALMHVDTMLRAAGVSAAQLSMAVIGLPGPAEFVENDRAESAANHGAPSSYLRRFRTWDGRSPTALLSERLECPVYSENDVNLAALGEATTGAGAGLATVFHVGLAHGTGAGLVINGKLHRGSSGLAGEIGHLHTEEGGRLCHCGAHGCFWQTRSIPALMESLAEAHGRPFSLADLAVAAAQQDMDIVRALFGFGEALGRRLADAVVFIDPNAIIIDGSLGEASHVIADGVRDAVRRFAPPNMAQSTKVLAGEHGIRAPLLGAVAFARSEQLFRPSVESRWSGAEG